jgi:diaminobutyrate-2-oxoglutarate transaminase
MIQGVSTTAPEMAGEISAKAFERGLLIETAGSESEVVKLLPPLLDRRRRDRRAFEILADSVDVVDRAARRRRSTGGGGS